MRKLLGQEYTQFVQYLGANIKDPKTQAIISAGVAERDGSAEDDVFGFAEVSIPVSKLRPTQSEIDIDKSLAYPLKIQPAGFIEKVTSNGPFTVVDRIVTYNGKYVIDGHHRWSTIYACNKNASINAIDLRMSGMAPLDVLKAVQMAIGVDTKNIPVNSVEGTNLLTIDRGALSGWIAKTVQPVLLQLIEKNPKAKARLLGAGAASIEEEEAPPPGTGAGDKPMLDAIANYVWFNVAAMKKTSMPVPGAGPRDFMPQTDDADWKKPLAKGVIDVKPPFAKAPKTVAEQKMTENFFQLIREEMAKMHITNK